MTDSMDQLNFFAALNLPVEVEDPESPKDSPIDPSCSKDGRVQFRYSAHLKKSIRVKAGFLFEIPEVMLPAYMESDDFVEARELAAEWAMHAIRRKTQKNRAAIKDLVERLWSLVDQILTDRGEISLSNRGRLPPIRPKGVHHDLEDILAAINDTYFENALQVKITWSNRIGGLSFHTVRKDPVTLEEFHLISISRGYDAANCPKYAIAGVVYHECLHVAIPVVEKNGRRIVHGRAFKERERQYLYYEEWEKWHREVLPRNIRALRRHLEL